MIIRALRPEERNLYNQAVNHPLQSWEWGDFRQETGVKIERLGFFEAGKLKKAIQVSFHELPYINRYIGYFPKGDKPDQDQMAALDQLAQKYNSIFIKLEPNITKPLDQSPQQNPDLRFLQNYQVEEGRPLFTKYSFQLDLSPSEEELMAKMSSKTRYNIRLAIKKGVKVFEDSSDRGLEDYIKVLEETTNRQKFYAHTPEYFRKMWDKLKDSGMMRIFKATYENQVLVTWIVFTFNGNLYYPYGASRDLHRDLMASNLMMWEVIRFGKAQNCQMFDMWGSLGPDPDKNDPWYGFHRFKKGYGGELVEFIGTHDLVKDYPIYKIYTVAENWRWRFLRLKKKLSK